MIEPKVPIDEAFLNGESGKWILPESFIQPPFPSNHSMTPS